MLGFGARAQQYFSEDRSYIKNFCSFSLAQSLMWYLLYYTVRMQSYTRTDSWQRRNTKRKHTRSYLICLASVQDQKYFSEDRSYIKSFCSSSLAQCPKLCCDIYSTVRMQSYTRTVSWQRRNTKRKDKISYLICMLGFGARTQQYFSEDRSYIKDISFIQPCPELCCGIYYTVRMQSYTRTDSWQRRNTKRKHTRGYLIWLASVQELSNISLKIKALLCWDLQCKGRALLLNGQSHDRLEIVGEWSGAAAFVLFRSCEGKSCFCGGYCPVWGLYHSLHHHHPPSSSQHRQHNYLLVLSPLSLFPLLGLIQLLKWRPVVPLSFILLSGGVSTILLAQAFETADCVLARHRWILIRMY
jgi:hypothetical protein